MNYILFRCVKLKEVKYFVDFFNVAKYFFGFYRFQSFNLKFTYFRAIMVLIRNCFQSELTLIFSVLIFDSFRNIKFIKALRFIHKRLEFPSGLRKRLKMNSEVVRRCKECSQFSVCLSVLVK